MNISDFFKIASDFWIVDVAYDSLKCCKPMCVFLHTHRCNDSRYCKWCIHVAPTKCFSCGSTSVGLHATFLGRLFLSCWKQIGICCIHIFFLHNCVQMLQHVLHCFTCCQKKGTAVLQMYKKVSGWREDAYAAMIGQLRITILSQMRCSLRRLIWISFYLSLSLDFS
jgi:hypothetical protein